MSEAVPIIFANGVAKFSVNIGGAPFMVRERHIKTGLLKKSLAK